MVITKKKGWIKEEHKNISIFNKNSTFFKHIKIVEILVGNNNDNAHMHEKW